MMARKIEKELLDHTNTDRQLFFSVFNVVGYASIAQGYKLGFIIERVGVRFPLCLLLSGNNICLTFLLRSNGSFNYLLNSMAQLYEMSGKNIAV
jgi:hypothetical protein